MKHSNKKHKCQKGGSVSKLGYKKNSPYKDEPYLDIQSNVITMKDVEFPIQAVPNGDTPVIMFPGQDYYFPNSTEVKEIPLKKLKGLKKQKGGVVKPNLQKLDDIEFDSNQARQGDGYLIVKDNKTGKDFGVVRNSDGSYRYAGVGMADFFEKHGNRVSEDHKGSLASSLFLAPVDYLTSLPQAATTYISSGGKEVLPSKALGIKNPIVGLGADIVLDPTNLVGAGLISKPLNKSNKLKTAATKAASHIQEHSFDESVAQIFSHPKETRPEVREVYDSLMERLHTAEGRKRFQDMQKWSQTKEIARNLPMITLGKDEKLIDNSYSWRPANLENASHIISGVHPEKDVRRVMRHELQHALQIKAEPTEIDYALGDLKMKSGFGKFTSALKTSKLKSFGTKFKDLVDAENYFLKGREGESTERSAFLSELQQHLMDTGQISHPYATHEITPELIQKAHASYNANRNTLPNLRILDIMKPTKHNYKLLADQLNKLPAAIPFLESDSKEEYKEGGIHIKPSKRGTFKAQATKMGMSVQEAASHILANKDNYSPAMVKKANFARNASKWEEGGQIPVIPEVPFNYANVEVEDAESVQLPTGRLAQFKGKTHEEGGINVDLPEGSFIFSDHLKAPDELKKTLGIKSKKKLSYADLSKKFATTPIMEHLEVETDEFTKATKQIDLVRNLANLKLIAETQEADKKMRENGTSLKSLKSLQKGGLVSVPPAKDPFSFDVSLEPETNFPDASNYPNKFDYIQNYANLQRLDPAYGKSYYKGLTNPGGPLSPTRGQMKFKAPTVKQAETEQLDLSTQRGWAGDRDAYWAAQNTDNQLYDSGSNLSEDFSDNSTTDNQSYNYTDAEQTELQDRDSSTGLSFKDKMKNLGRKVKTGVSNFSIDPALAGTIADVALIASNKLKVEQPTLYNTTKNPIFSQYKRIEPRESQKALSLAISSVQNSSLPESVKQARIADLNAKYLDVQSQSNANEAMRYQQFQDQNLNKLQSYMDQNVNERYKNLDQYTRERGAILRQENKFKTWKNQEINNAIRNYLDYAQTTNVQNKLSDRNYTVNPITGKIKFKETDNKLDSLAAQWESQFGSSNVMDLGNGVRGKMIKDPSTGEYRLFQFVQQTDGSYKLEALDKKL